MTFDFKLSVIGVGNMGAALVRGIVRAGALDAACIIVSDADQGRCAALATELGVHTASSNKEAAAWGDYVVLAVKPGLIESVIGEIANSLRPEQVLVSIAAGVPLSKIRAALGTAQLVPSAVEGPALVRIMPNTPALVGAGCFALAAPQVAPARIRDFADLLSAIGIVVPVEEHLMDAVTALSGSGPAFVFVMIEALADGGVAAGLPRSIANKLAAYTVFGAAKMVLDTGQHPSALKDAVASPGGTTIAGLGELERSGFRAALQAAVKAAAKRARELSGE